MIQKRLNVRKRRYYTVMIKEDYVSYEVAKLLKEKGFNEDCKAYYEDGKFCWVWNDGCSRNTDNPKYVSCPTHQRAMKWLRDKYNFHISIAPYIDREDEHKITWVWEVINTETTFIVADSIGIFIPTHEEAVDAALKYCLTKRKL